MNKQFTLGAALLLLGSGIVGCSNTAEGVKDDTKDAGTAVQKGAENAADNVKKAGDQTAAAVKDTGTAIQKGGEKAVAGTEAAVKDTGTAIQKGGEKAVAGTEKAVAGAGAVVAGAGEAAVTTPMVSTAIDKDAELGNTSLCKINVDTKNSKVILCGHVKTNEMKKKAEAIAKKALADNNRTEPVVNQLTVDAH